MKSHSLLLSLCISVLMCISCTNASNENLNNTSDSTNIKTLAKDSVTSIDREAALKIANDNAITAYRDLSIYEITAELKDGKWYVDYNLTDPQMTGGGPHYVISEATGEILNMRYEQ